MNADVVRGPVTEFADVETSSDGYASRFSGDVGEFFLDVQTRTILDLLRPWPGARVLDVGGGHGQVAPHLVAAGHRVTVAGSSAACQARLERALPSGGYDFQVGNLLSLPFADRSFDVVVSFRLLPHVEPWENLVSELCRLAKKAVIVDYPDLRSANIFSKIFFRTKKAIETNTRPFRCFSRRELMREFRKSNFDQPVFRPEYFVPMALHRALGKGAWSRRVESFAKRLGLTSLLGSPVILRVTPR